MTHVKLSRLRPSLIGVDTDAHRDCVSEGFDDFFVMAKTHLDFHDLEWCCL